MQDDLTDAVRWAIAQGIADPRRVAIFGESYGGYATLAGLAFTPELYACGVAINGVSDLIAELVLFQAYRPSSREDWARWVGRVPVYMQGERAGQLKDEQDWTGAERKEVEFLRSRSPLFHAHRVRAPLLIAHGARDTRGSIEQSTRIVKALRRRGVEVEHVMYEDEGHWLARPETYLDLHRRAEKFLARHLGGRCMAP